MQKDLQSTEVAFYMMRVQCIERCVNVSKKKKKEKKETVQGLLGWYWRSGTLYSALAGTDKR